MSSPNKALELQLQVRQNAEELQDFMRELESWEANIKQKDEELKKQREAVIETDKALEELEKDDSTHECVSLESDSEEDGIHVDAAKALAEKEQGNDFFKQGKFDDAIECYTRAMSADPYSPVIPTNRASAFFRKKKYSVAESDCNLAIALDKSYVQAYTRRGAARFALGKLEEAKKDYEKVQELDPENFESVTELRKINEILLSKNLPEEKKIDQLNKEPSLKEEEKKQIEEQQLKQQAISQKDLGNGYFKEGKYEAAIECYSRGIAADGTNALLPANRAMAYLKLQKYEEAEQDCTQAIALDGTYSKAYARRGAARVALKKLTEAKADFEMVLKLEPGNKQAVNELTKIKKELVARGLLTEEPSLDPEFMKTEQRKLVKPIDKPVHLRSAKPLRRIVIEEIGDERQVNIVPTTAEALLMAEKTSPLTTFSPPTVKQNKPSQNETVPIPDAPSAKVLKIEEMNDAPANSSVHLQPKMDDAQPALSISKNVKDVAEPKVPEALPLSSSLSIPAVPANSFQLEADFRKLKDYPDMMYQYLKQIKPSSYPQLFQKSLEPDIFMQIMNVLHKSYIKNEEPSLILEILRSLSEVKRFDMAVMFMSSAEKNVVQDLFCLIQELGIEEASITALKKRYGI
ncbi:RNA polymerase II-associated protein 3 isoform X2 [Latimeria chalumnae]|uniref:RNA polymerase II-associated protein 3 isoform X2 n=1 Tax=Latimeria chalumnae TaxID=7897 RepID=UPI00313DA3B0